VRFRETTPIEAALAERAADLDYEPPITPSPEALAQAVERHPEESAADQIRLAQVEEVLRRWHSHV
jgi:hypothetical protein